MPVFTDKCGREWQVNTITPQLSRELGRRTASDHGESLVDELWRQCRDQAALRGVTMMEFVKSIHDGDVIARAAVALTGNHNGRK